MAESPTTEETNERRLERAEKGVRWDALAAMVASLVGLLALVVACYTAYIQREQVRAQVWPYLIWSYSSIDSKLEWTNKGVGPAIIRSLSVEVDGKPQSDWTSTMRDLKVFPIGYTQNSLNGNVLSPGETIDWIQFDDKSQYTRFIHAAQQTHASIDICYCSTLGDCWLTHFWKSDRKRVKTCPASAGSNQFQQ